VSTLWRYPIAVLLSGVLTAGLFGGLRLLINVRAEVNDSVALSKVEFVRLRREVEIEEKKREKPERAKPEQAPVTPTLPSRRKRASTSTRRRGDRRGPRRRVRFGGRRRR
jgi:hypothetical protein